jgi:hypothetical protein
MHGLMERDAVSQGGGGGNESTVPYTAGGKGKGCTTDMTHSGWIGVERMWKGVQAVTGGGHRRGSMHTRPPLEKYLPTAAFLRCSGISSVASVFAAIIELTRSDGKPCTTCAPQSPPQLILTKNIFCSPPMACYFV